MSNYMNPEGFEALNLPRELCSLLKRHGIEIPTPIQAEAIPVALEGEDLIGVANTGTGKTLAFGIPMVLKLQQGDVGLILAPTRELAQQICDSYWKLNQKTVLIVGGASMGIQIANLRKEHSVIVATPGRLIDHLDRGTVNLSRVTMLVLDEADRMLDMGFAPAIKRVLNYVPRERQTLLFSATMPSEIEDLARNYMRNPVRVEVAQTGSTPDLIQQELMFVPFEEKQPLLQELLYQAEGSVLVFTRTRHGARKVAKAVRNHGHSAVEIHADRTLAQRRIALQGFKDGEYRVLVATDIAARGIDVKDISLVVNYDVPENPEDYIHRIGRTGRAGTAGRSITIALPQQSRAIRDIERLMGMKIPIVDRPELTVGTTEPVILLEDMMEPAMETEELVLAGVSTAPVVSNSSEDENSSRPPRESQRPRYSDDRPSREPRSYGDRPSGRFGRGPSDRPYGRKPFGDRPRDDRPDDRPRYENRDREERPNERRDDDRPRYGDRNRDDRPRYGGDRPRNDRPGYGDRNRGDRPSYGGDRPRNDRPGYGDRNQGDRPSYGNRDDRPRYGGDRNRDDRPSYGNRDGDRPYGRKPFGDRNNDRPGFGDRNRGDRPGYGNRDGDRPRYGDRNREDRPSYGNRDGDRPRYGDRNREDRPSYGNRDGDRPRYGDRNREGDRPYGRKPFGDRNNDRNRDDRPYGKKSFGDRDRQDAPRGDRFQRRDDDRPRFDRESRGKSFDDRREPRQRPADDRGDRPRSFDRNAPLEPKPKSGGFEPPKGKWKKGPKKPKHAARKAAQAKAAEGTPVEKKPHRGWSGKPGKRRV